jgi:hypothetical protein
MPLPGSARSGKAEPMDNQSCCCPSRAVARVIMPPTAERPHEVELLLCGHHLRLSQLSGMARFSSMLAAWGFRQPGSPRAAILSARVVGGRDYEPVRPAGSLS